MSVPKEGDLARRPAEWRRFDADMDHLFAVGACTLRSQKAAMHA